MPPDDQQQQQSQQQSQQQQSSDPWFKGFDAETIGHLQNRGWDKKQAPEVVAEAIKSWKEAEKLVGVPANQVVRLPKDASDEKGWDAVWQRLGKPNDAKLYDFSDVKFADGTALEDGFVNTVRETAFKLNLPKDTATAFTRAFAKYLDDADITEKAEKTAKLAEQKAALKTNWGKNEAANTFVAQRAAAALGIAPETVSALESVIGYDKIMEMFRSIGAKIGEDKFITGAQTPAGGGAMTREEALAKKQDLMSNAEWRKAYLGGDKAKFREMQALEIIITGITAQAA